jgi:hypothetical protein
MAERNRYLWDNHAYAFEAEEWHPLVIKWLRKKYVHGVLPLPLSQLSMEARELSIESSG